MAQSQSAQNYCPVCGENLPADFINIQEGVALCSACGQLSRLSEVVSHKRPVTEILEKPPKGCSITEWGQDVVIYASCRSMTGFLGALAFSLFWNGIVSVFVLVALAGLYTNLVGPVPAWFPAPQMNQPMNLGMTLFLCIFLLPFVTVGVVMIGAVVMTLAGKVEVSVGETEGVVRTGVGVLAWRSRFDATAVRRVTMGTSTWQNNQEKSSPVIVIEADRTIKFGSMLTEERREWTQVVLQQWFTRSDTNQRLELLSQIRRAASGF